jgi:hypothetical protein
MLFAQKFKYAFAFFEKASGNLQRLRVKGAHDLLGLLLRQWHTPSLGFLQ